MAINRISISNPSLLKHSLFHKSPKTLHFSCCSSSNKPSTQENRETIEDEICRLMETEEWSTRVQTSIRDLVPSFDRNMLYTVLDRNPGRALEFSQWVDGSGLFKHDRESYHKMIEILCKDGKVEDAKRILLDMPNKGIECDEDAFVLLINGYSKCDRKWDIVKKCLKLFLKMEEFGVQRTIKSYNAMFQVMINEKKFTLAEKYFDKMLSEGIFPNTHTYVVLILGFCGSSRLETANRFFQHMKSQQISPDFVLYNAMINGYSRVRKMEEAEKVLLEMKELNMKPNLSTYNGMINGYAQVRKMDNAEMVFSEMERSNTKPTLITYNTMINGYAQIEKMEAAVRLVAEMKGRNMEADLVTYVTMIKGYLLGKRVDEASKLLQEMKRRGVGRTIDASKCLGVLPEVCDAEQMPEAQRVVLQGLEDHVNQLELLAMRDAARELSELANRLSREKTK